MTVTRDDAPARVAPEDLDAHGVSTVDPPRRTSRWRSSGRLWAALLGAALLWSLWGSGLGRQPVVNAPGWDTMREFWAAALHPDLSADYLGVTAEAALTTVAFALLGTLLAVAFGLVGGVLLSETWWRSAPVASRTTRVRRRVAWFTGRVGLGLPRGIHEAVWGLFLVTILGRDPLAGVLAIAIPFGAITAKVYAELIDETDQGPYRAMAAAGSGRVTAIAYGLLPLTWRDLVSYGFYRFDCALRSAVILGMIGVGGLGFELSLTFQALAYEQMWTLIYALVILGTVVDAWGARLRSGVTRRWLWVSLGAGVVLTVGSVVHLGPDLARAVSGRTWSLFTGLVDAALPPLPPTSWGALLQSTLATLQMSILAIAIGGFLGVLTAFVAARDPSQGWLRRVVATAARGLLLVIRAISPPVWALVLLFVLFPGPLPGAVALGVYNVGVLGRLFAEVVENLDHRPAAVLRASGAGAVGAFWYATLPLAMNKFAAYSLYRWEIAIRETVVVGVVGAGGLGRILEERRAAFDYPSMLAVVIALLAVSLVVDFVSSAARNSWR